MEFVIGNKALLGLIFALSAQAELPPEMALAIIEAESGGNPYATAYSPAAAAKTQLKRPAICSDGMESVQQRTAWGLMQVMGLTARGLGFEGWLSELVEPELNIRLGITYLSQLKTRFYETHGIDGVIAAYRKGTPRRTTEGKFTCQGYVDRVKTLMAKHKDVFGEFGEAGEPEAAIITSGLDERLSGSREELLVLAKEMGVDVSSRAKRETIVEKLRAVIGDADV